MILCERSTEFLSSILCGKAPRGTLTILMRQREHAAKYVLVQPDTKKGNKVRRSPAAIKQTRSPGACIACGFCNSYFCRIGREFRTTAYTGTAGSFQMSRAYSWMVRSLENLPTRAVLRIAILAQRALSR